MSEEEHLILIGTLVDGQVVAVRPWGVVVEFGVSILGLIDRGLVDEGEVYEIGQSVRCVVEQFERRRWYLRPEGKPSADERLEQFRALNPPELQALRQAFENERSQNRSDGTRND